MLYTILSHFMNREATAQVSGTPSQDTDDVLYNTLEMEATLY